MDGKLEPLTLKKTHRLKALEKRLLRRIFGPKTN
jgi:hypothetical protein